MLGLGDDECPRTPGVVIRDLFVAPLLALQGSSRGPVRALVPDELTVVSGTRPLHKGTRLVYWYWSRLLMLRRS